MTTRSSPLLLLVPLCLAWLLTPSQSRASHFQAATISWDLPYGTPDLVRFTISSHWRSSYGNYFPDMSGAPVPGNVHLDPSTTFKVIDQRDGTVSLEEDLEFLITAVDDIAGSFSAESVYEVSVPSGAQVLAELYGVELPPTLQNNPGLPWRVSSFIDISSVAPNGQSPRILTHPTLPVPFGAATAVTIPVLTGGADSVVATLGTGADGPSASAAPGITLDPGTMVRPGLRALSLTIDPPSPGLYSYDLVIEHYMGGQVVGSVEFAGRIRSVEPPEDPTAELRFEPLATVVDQRIDVMLDGSGNASLSFDFLVVPGDGFEPDPSNPVDVHVFPPASWISQNRTVLDANGSRRLTVHASPPVADYGKSFLLPVRGKRWADSGKGALPGEQVVQGWYELVFSDAATSVDPSRAHRSLVFEGSHPNPFGHATSIEFTTAGPATVVVDVVDARGRRVTTFRRTAPSAGAHSLEWSGTDSRGQLVAPGLYFVRLSDGRETLTRKILRLE